MAGRELGVLTCWLLFDKTVALSHCFLCWLGGLTPPAQDLEAQQCSMQDMLPLSPSSPWPSHPQQKALLVQRKTTGSHGRHFNDYQNPQQRQHAVWSEPFRTQDRARKLRGAEGAGWVCDVSAGAASGVARCHHSAAAAPVVVGLRAIQSFASAPAGALDGGEWCTIPLSSPDCTPRKGVEGPGGQP